MTKTVSEILDAAADLIEPEGAWTQGYFGMWDGSTCFCAVGAIGRAAGFRRIDEAENWVEANAADLLGMGWFGLEDWNDRPDRTQAEVVAKLREAAEKAREQGL